MRKWHAEMQRTQGKFYTVLAIRYQLKIAFMEINDVTGVIITESIKIHRDVGPGLLESVYEELLYYRLTKRGLKVKRQEPIIFIYEEVRMNVNLRYDLMVEEKVLVELKSQETVPPVAYKIFKTYLRLTKISIGLLINFNVEVLREGIKRIANNYVET
jgi:GxxExxY protein